MTNRMSSSTEPLQILKANFLSVVIIFAVLFIVKQSEAYSRFIVIIFFLFNLLIPVYIMPQKRKLFKLPWLREKILVIGDQRGISAFEQWVRSEFSGFDIHTRHIDEKLKDEDFESIFSNSNEQFYYAIAIAANTFSSEALFAVTEKAQQYFSRVLVIPNFGKFPLLNAKILGSIECKGIVLSVPNNLLNPYDQIIKNIFDAFVSSVLLLMIFPFLLVLYLIMLVVTKGKPVYRQERIGKHGKPFFIYKFTSMRPDADVILQRLLENDSDLRAEWESDRKLKDDPRITKFGRFLRRTSLDELPQFYNVLRGEMSLVGPRPIVQSEREKYGEYFRYYEAVKPGITGLWQVSGRNDVDYEERVQLDVWYVRNWSVDLDLMILLRTLSAVLHKQGSY